jgi:hypothetical protein
VGRSIGRSVPATSAAFGLKDSDLFQQRGDVGAGLRYEFGVPVGLRPYLGAAVAAGEQDTVLAVDVGSVTLPRPWRGRRQSVGDGYRVEQFMPFRRFEIQTPTPPDGGAGAL